jgi:hypothetical protein
MLRALCSINNVKIEEFYNFDILESRMIPMKLNNFGILVTLAYFEFLMFVRNSFN